jgi:FlaA1/EpsC-like NDP-sugar epimerase
MMGFIDDDPAMARAKMQGYPVLGDFSSLASLISNSAVDTVVITTHLISVDRLETLRRLCAEHQVALARLHFKLDEIVAAS